VGDGAHARQVALRAQAREPVGARGRPPAHRAGAAGGAADRALRRRRPRRHPALSRVGAAARARHAVQPRPRARPHAPAVAHRHPDGLMRTAVVEWKGGVGATLTLVRAYESSWVLQHSAVASPAVPANPGMLHSLLVRLAIPRADGEYVCGYIDEEARSQHAVMGAFFSHWSTPEHRGATRFVLYSAPSRSQISKRTFTSRARARKLGRRDELLVEHAALRAMDPVCARALGLRAGEITLPETQQQYARAGLE